MQNHTHKSIFIALLILIVFVGTSSAQESACILKLDQLPEVRGFKLGMTLQDIRKNHPAFTVPGPDERGYTEYEYFISYFLSAGEVSLIREADRKGLQKIDVAFLDNKLVYLRITYDDSVEWEGISDFLKTITASLKLPDANQWKSIDTYTRLLTCDGVSIKATIVTRGASIAFVQKGIREVLAGREKNLKARKRQEFKP